MGTDVRFPPRAVAPFGHLLVVEGPKGISRLRGVVEESGWGLLKPKSNRLLARRPEV